MMWGLTNFANYDKVGVNYKKDKIMDYDKDDLPRSFRSYLDECDCSEDVQALLLIKNECYPEWELDYGLDFCE